jgi:hypothetical protein
VRYSSAGTAEARYLQASTGNSQTKKSTIDKVKEIW